MLEAFVFMHSPKAGTRLEVLALDVEITLMKRPWAFFAGDAPGRPKFPKKNDGNQTAIGVL
jgi:hypothetical protein